MSFQSALAKLTGVRSLAVRAARADPDAFAGFVLRDGFSGQPVVQAPHHSEMQRLITAQRRLTVIAPPEAGKSEQLIARAVWELARAARSTPVPPPTRQLSNARE